MSIIFYVEYVSIADNRAAGRIADALQDSILGDGNPRIFDRDFIAGWRHPCSRKVTIGDRATWQTMFPGLLQTLEPLLVCERSIGGRGGERATGK